MNPIGDKEFVELAAQIAYGELDKDELSKIMKVQSLSGAGGLMLLF